MTAVGSRYGLRFARRGRACERGSCIGQGFGNINFFKEELLVWLKDG